ncbi:hypothetical protein M408DRAFT_8151 [Serendipita vermifera MAFF 305830]|uniref:FH2 domain-containing protein n=1 Tax=Serendipita vermifera MAFF 305830 TaxID=933852 RepID=A0A0C3AY53_SERVB|nr:hypothetical protein M408DRAFT_8151 [Serendipita vermifera MAFF 305830]
MDPYRCNHCVDGFCQHCLALIQNISQPTATPIPAHLPIIPSNPSFVQPIGSLQGQYTPAHQHPLGQPLPSQALPHIPLLHGLELTLNRCYPKDYNERLRARLNAVLQSQWYQQQQHEPAGALNEFVYSLTETQFMCTSIGHTIVLRMAAVALQHVGMKPIPRICSVIARLYAARPQTIPGRPLVKQLGVLQTYLKPIISDHLYEDQSSRLPKAGNHVPLDGRLTPFESGTAFTPEDTEILTAVMKDPANGRVIGTYLLHSVEHSHSIWMNAWARTRWTGRLNCLRIPPGGNIPGGGMNGGPPIPGGNGVWALSCPKAGRRRGGELTMTSVPLIVPTLSPSGAIHFAAVRREATAQDIIDALSVLDEVKEDILGDLQENAWAVQRIHRGLEGRLLSGTSKLADGLLDSTESISPLVASTKPPAMQRHFSAFPLSSHLHTPSLRLVSLHPLLRASLSCARIPDLEDDIELEWFLSRNTTVLDMVNGVIEELDLAKVIPGPGGGNVDYVLEEVWVSDQGDEIVSRLHDALLVSQIVETAVRDYPFPTKTRAKRILRFCVPDEWYRRSKSRSLSLTPIESGGTLRPNSEDGNSDEEGGTAKQRNKATGSSAMRRDAQESRQSGRFSLFEGWGTVSSTSSGTVALAHASPGDRNTISVSAPLAVMSPQQTGISAVFGQEMDLSEDNVSAEFERMMDDIGLKDDKREAMRSMPLERKQYLLMQSKQSRSTIGTSSQSQRQGSNQGSDSTQSVITPISPQVTGMLRRFSLWGAPSGSPTVSSPAPEPESREPVQESLPIVPQITGSLWGNWWLGSPRETETPREGDRTKPNSTEWYVDGIRNGKTTDTRLAKHLISLRVHLSTAKVAWIERFLGEEKGMDALAALLQSLIDKGGKGRKLSDIEGIILLEVIKCLRVLLNTAPGYPYVIQSPTIITHIAFTLHGASPKLRALSSDLLAAICVISLNEGHRLVLGALSDYRVSFDERFRFDDLINALRIEENSTSQEGEQDGVWEARGATMGLIIALTSCSDSIEERILLREEFSRRGLNEVMVGLRYLKPPDSLLKQLDAYSEDKYEDEEDIRDQLRALARKQHGVNNNKADDSLDSWLQNLEVSSPETSASLRTTLKALSKLSEEATTSNFKMDILFICEKFVENAALLGDFEEHWVIFLDRFAEAIHHLIPKPFPSIKDEANGHVKDFELLQEQVRSMSTTISSLQNELAGQTAELDTLRSLSQSFESSQLPSKAPGKTGPNAEIRGFVTRLVQKEKQVAQLQADLVRLQSKSQAPQDAPEEQAKREREQMKIKKVTEELNALKSKNTELEGIIAAKAKEIVYLKRALESVYSRFHASAQESEQERRHGPESEVDVQSMTNHTIEGLAKKEEEIKALQDTVISLQAQLSNSHATTLDTSALEKQFKARTAPPPPPPIKPKKPASNGPLSATPQGTLASPTSNVSASFTNTSEQGQFMERTVESAKQEAGSRLELELAEVRPDLDMVRNAAAEIKASKRLRKVLGTVLVVGNTLNGSTFRGGARGFQLDALLKMKETKTAKSGTDCPTLLHYLAKILMREDAGLIMFGEELSHVEAAARVSVQFILSTVNSLCQGMERVKDELEVIRSAQMSSEDFFIAKMEPFVRKMEPAVHNLRLSGQALETELQGLLLFFGEAVEGPEATKPEDFFNLVLSFSRALQVSFALLLKKEQTKQDF